MSTLRDRLDFTGKNVLVTGGSKGIGRAVVEGFAGLGARVFFTYRTQDDSVRSLIASGTAGMIEGIASDATDPSSYASLRATMEKRVMALDVLMNNVGDAVRRSPFLESDDALWTETMNLNVLSAVRATKTVLPLLAKASTGVIVNMSSIAAHNGGTGDSLHYAVSKGALITLTRGLVHEVKGTPIRVVGVAPSAIDTDFQKKHSSAERRKKIIETTPLGRMGAPREVADVVVFLASDGASYITGETIFITGGRR